MDILTEARQSWLDCLWRIGRIEVSVFEGNNDAYVDNLIYCNCRRHIMIWIYSALVMNKKLLPLETLDEESKTQNWEFVKEICAGKTRQKKRMIEIAKTFYVIEYFLNERDGRK